MFFLLEQYRILIIVVINSCKYVDVIISTNAVLYKKPLCCKMLYLFLAYFRVTQVKPSACYSERLLLSLL